MSRIGRKPVQVPKGAKVSIDGSRVSVEGPNGSLSLDVHPRVSVAMDEGGAAVVVSIDPSDAGEKQVRALWGTTRALINNMITGVTTGYTRGLEIVGVGWRAELAANVLRLRVGYANIVAVPVPPGLTVKLEKDQHITITGPDKQAVGAFAAYVRSIRKPEPYNGKGIKYAGEVIQRKAGKAFGK